MKKTLLLVVAAVLSCMTAMAQWLYLYIQKVFECERYKQCSQSCRLA